MACLRALLAAAPIMPSAFHPAATFDASNAVGLGWEIVIVLLIAASFVAGLAFLFSARPAATATAHVLAAGGRQVLDGQGPVLVLAAVVGVAAYLWLDHLNGQPWPGHDQTQSLVLVQDCLKLSTCHLTSVDSGLPGFTNGAVWLHVLTAIGLLGGTTVAARATLLVSMAAAVSTIFLCSWRWLRPAFALPAALLALAGVAGGHGWEPGPGEVSAANLVDASALFFPAAVCACALLIFVHTRRTAALVVAAVFASHAANTHVAGVSLLPALLAAAVLAGRRPLRSAGLSVVIYGVTALISSPATLLISAAHLQSTALAGLAAIVALCSMARSRFLRLGSAGRAGVLAVWLLAPLAGGALLLQRPLSSRYIAPVLAPLSVATAGLMIGAGERLLGRNRRIAGLAQVFAVLFGVACLVRRAAQPAAEGWTFEDGRVLAEHLDRRGWCYARQFARLQGPQCTLLAYALMPYACYGAADDAAIDARRQLRVWRVERGHLPVLPHGAETIPSGPDRVILVSEADSWLDTAQAELCIASEFPGGSPSACRRAGDPDASPFLYSHRLSLGFPDAMFQPPIRMTYSFPLRPTAGQTHQILFLDDPFSRARPGCGWQVRRVVGAETDRPLPANPVRLTSPDGTPGSLVIERVVGGTECREAFPGWQIPCHLETEADDPAWMKEPGSWAGFG